MDEATAKEIAVGDVVQIMPGHDPGDGSRLGWVGAFALVTEVKSWGIKGFVHHMMSNAESGAAYIRLKHEDFERVGKAPHVDSRA